jgi:class 3 adenylate cyclase
LKDGESVIADRFDEASVLFADIADFTPMSGTMEPQELVELLNDVFIEFDRLADHYRVENSPTSPST